MTSVLTDHLQDYPANDGARRRLRADLGLWSSGRRAVGKLGGVGVVGLLS